MLEGTCKIMGSDSFLLVKNLVLRDERALSSVTLPINDRTQMRIFVTHSLEL